MVAAINFLSMPRGRRDKGKGEGIEAAPVALPSSLDEESARSLLGFFRCLSRLGGEEKPSNETTAPPTPKP